MIRPLLTALLLASPALAADRPQGWTPDSIPWQRTNPDGTRFALREGRRDTAAEPFSYAFFIPAGVWDGPHSHSQTARVFVARGTLWLGYGNRLDRSKARAFPAGSYVLVPAGAVHFDGSDRDTMIIGTASGTWSTDYIDKAAPPSAGTTPR
jgi:hypothetical protein